MELGLIPKKRKDNDIEKIYAKDKVEPHYNIKNENDIIRKSLDCTETNKLQSKFMKIMKIVKQKCPKRSSQSYSNSLETLSS